MTAALFPCPGCGRDGAVADDGHRICRTCEGYPPPRTFEQGYEQAIRDVVGRLRWEDDSPETWSGAAAEFIERTFKTSPGEGTAAASPSDGGDLRTDAPSPGEDKARYVACHVAYRPNCSCPHCTTKEEQDG